MNAADSRMSRKRASSSGIRGSYCALTSTSGIVCTAGHSSCTYPAIKEIRREHDDACDDRVIRIAQVVVRMRVGAAERPPGGSQPEAEDRAAEQREDEELAERDAHDPGGDRDEGADDGQGEAERDGPVAEALEPALGPVELRVRDVHEAAVPAQERPPAAGADQPADRRAGDVAEGAGEGDADVGPEGGVDGRPEDVHRDAREGAARDGAGIEHHELAPDGHARRDDEQAEDGVEAVVADGRRDRARDGREQHRRRVYERRATKGATSETLPTVFVATTCSWYAPVKASAPV